MRGAIAAALAAVLALTGCGGGRESLRPYVGVPAMSCEELRASMIELARRIDTRSTLNGGASIVSTGTQAAVVAGAVSPAAAALPLALGGFRLGDKRLRRALEARYHAALRLGCELPASMLQESPP